MSSNSTSVSRCFSIFLLFVICRCVSAEKPISSHRHIVDVPRGSEYVLQLPISDVYCPVSGSVTATTTISDVTFELCFDGPCGTSHSLSTDRPQTLDSHRLVQSAVYVKVTRPAAPVDDLIIKAQPTATVTLALDVQFDTQCAMVDGRVGVNTVNVTGMTTLQLYLGPLSAVASVSACAGPLHRFLLSGSTVAAVGTIGPAVLFSNVTACDSVDIQVDQSNIVIPSESSCQTSTTFPMDTGADSLVLSPATPAVLGPRLMVWMPLRVLTDSACTDETLVIVDTAANTTLTVTPGDTAHLPQQLVVKSACNVTLVADPCAMCSVHTAVCRVYDGMTAVCLCDRRYSGRFCDTRDSPVWLTLVRETLILGTNIVALAPALLFLVAGSSFEAAVALVSGVASTAYHASDEGLVDVPFFASAVVDVFFAVLLLTVCVGRTLLPRHIRHSYYGVCMAVELFSVAMNPWNGLVFAVPSVALVLLTPPAVFYFIVRVRRYGLTRDLVLIIHAFLSVSTVLFGFTMVLLQTSRNYMYHHSLFHVAAYSSAALAASGALLSDKKTIPDRGRADVTEAKLPQNHDLP
ncbi:Protein of unknown function DUF3522 [Carpediemonas membranifera]|uniref:EGF-like domain-containing protein n=1 Tax=Carpediemonas membranifera TaxID=201153 RepID=A0A8J6E7B6_9EUKA|nr:Protein of unknown function DUF3522 [Carpediemonas membranifera]|eukprot:KAG9390535.1 Protein of unknown function DUF3522 [Carpediemonas membranifera]